MKIPVKKLQNGFAMPVFGIGTWMMGGDKFRNPRNDGKANIESIKFAIESGIIHIDTAENYAEGYTEKIVGRAIKGFDRKELFISSKLDKRNLRFHDLLKSASKMNSCEHIRENLGAIGWQMENSDIELLRRDFPNQKERSEILPLV